MCFPSRNIILLSSSADNAILLTSSVYTLWRWLIITFILLICSHWLCNLCMQYVSVWHFLYTRTLFMIRRILIYFIRTQFSSQTYNLFVFYLFHLSSCRLLSFHNDALYKSTFYLLTYLLLTPVGILDRWSAPNSPVSNQITHPRHVSVMVYLSPIHRGY